MRHWSFIAFLVFAIALTAGCQNVQPPGPTVIPTDVTDLPELHTVTPSPSRTLAPPATMTEPPTVSGPTDVLPTLRPVVTAPGLAPTAVSVAEQPAPAATTPPRCIQAKQGDTLYVFAIRGGYADLNGSLAAIRAMNNMCDGCNDIEIGRTYCLPAFTPTPTPVGYEATQAIQLTEMPALATQRSFTLINYKIREDDTGAIALVIHSGATLQEICSLNQGKVGCTGCNLTAPLGQWGCRPVIPSPGTILQIPGPPPTMTITPTLTGLETATPTPAYAMPRIVAPVMNAEIAGTPQLSWLVVGILQPDEFFLVRWSDMSTQQTHEHELHVNALRLDAQFKPAAGERHIVNWQVSVARNGPNGAIEIISPMSPIYTFTWVGD